MKYMYVNTAAEVINQHFYAPVIIYVSDENVVLIYDWNLSDGTDLIVERDQNNNLVINEYIEGTISYSSDYGTVPSSKSVRVPYTLTAQDLPTLSQEGYVFEGWNKQVGDVITENTIITASWREVANMFKIKSTGTSTINFTPISYNTIDVDYSFDNGGTWNTWDGSSDITINDGQIVTLKGDNPNGFISTIVATNSGGGIEASGNVMSLIDDGCCCTLSVPTNCFAHLFYECSVLTSISDLILPATDLNYYCYGNMFYKCTGLTTVPTDLLPATTLAESCYNDMFWRCTSLQNVPNLPATTLAPHCYSEMFSGCTSLTTVPTDLLPATTLADYCYSNMFSGCTSLVVAPELLATSILVQCYNSMFQHCRQLNYIKCLATSRYNNSSTVNWLYDVAATGTFVKAAGANFWPNDESGIPTGWTVQEVAA